MNTPNITRDTSVFYNFKCPKCKETTQTKGEPSQQPTCKCGHKMILTGICGRFRRAA